MIIVKKKRNITDEHGVSLCCGSKNTLTARCDEDDDVSAFGIVNVILEKSLQLLKDEVMESKKRTEVMDTKLEQLLRTKNIPGW